MNEREIPFLKELRAELRRAAQQAPEHPHTFARGRPLVRIAMPALLAIAALGYVLLGVGGGSHKIPVRDYETSAGYHPQTKYKLVGNPACVAQARSHRLPRLVHSESAPSPALMSELSLLRRPSTPLDATSLGSWDHAFPPITTLYQRYVRVIDGPRGVRLAFLPVAYCSESVSSGDSLHRVERFASTEGLVMLVLSNPGEHPAVMVGGASLIKHGPALAGLDLSNQKGWVQSIVVPDGVARVVMKFTPAFQHRYSNTVETPDNVGIVVRKTPSSPTTVLWYSANGKLIKRFVFRRQIALLRCLSRHRKDCGLTQQSAAELAKLYVIPLSLPADPQARALYEPLTAYARSTTATQRANARTASAKVTPAINRCDAQHKRLFQNVRLGTRNTAAQARAALYMLWDHVAGMQSEEATVAPVASQLRQLADAWAKLSLRNHQMTAFAHGVAEELLASLNGPPVDTCAFVDAVAAHHYSYAWARGSKAGRVAAHWWRRELAGGNLTNAFWRFVNPPLGSGPGGAGQNLFTKGEARALANLPGEQG